MSLSCIVTTYNKPKHLVRTLERLSTQLADRDEIIVVNDGGQDVSSIAHDCGARYVWIPDKGYRLSTARNVGIWLANNDNILQLDDDILLQEGSVGYVKRTLVPGRLLVGRIDWQTESGEIVPDERLTGQIKAWDGGQLFPVAVYGGLLAYTRQDAFRVGLWSEEFNGRWGGEDADFGFRMLHPDLGDCQGIFSGNLYGIHQWHPKRKGFREEQEKNRELLYQRMVSLLETGLVGQSEPHPLVQVFVTHWRRRKKLKKCLEALEKQDIELDVHILVQGEEAEANAVSKITQYPVHYLGPNKGCFYSRWYAATHLRKAPFIVFLDNDIYLPPSAISRMLAPLIAGDADVVVGKTRNLLFGRLVVKGNEIFLQKEQFNGWQMVDYAGFGLSAWKADVFDCCSFDPEYRVGGGDLDMSLQLKEKGKKLAVLSIPGIVHNGGGDGVYLKERYHNEHIRAAWRRIEKKWGLVPRGF